MALVLVFGVATSAMTQVGAVTSSSKEKVSQQAAQAASDDALSKGINAEVTVRSAELVRPVQAGETPYWEVLVGREWQNGGSDVFVFKSPLKDEPSALKLGVATEPSPLLRQSLEEARYRIPQGINRVAALNFGDPGDASIGARASNQSSSWGSYLAPGFLIGKTNSQSGSSTGYHFFVEWGHILSIRPNLILSSKETINPNWTGISSSGLGLGYQSAKQHPDQVLQESVSNGLLLQQVQQRQTQNTFYPITDVILSLPHNLFGLGVGFGPAYVAQKGVSRIVENIAASAGNSSSTTRILSQQEFSRSGAAMNLTLMIRILFLDIQFQKPIIGGLGTGRNFSLGIKIPLNL
ncbi:MAG: hypothetical protein HY551_07030 [Elusimicrobia bacterium]|nr:hypothetical protein [Elusimicrobiota bacterium]